MFRAKQSDGRYVWINPTYVQAVVPGKELNQSLVLVQGSAIQVDGIADEIGKAITMMMAGAIPMADFSQKRES